MASIDPATSGQENNKRFADCSCGNIPLCQQSETECKDIEQPIEADFIAKFRDNKGHQEWYKIIETKYGADRLSELNQTLPLIVERIIQTLNSTERSDQIILRIENVMKYFDDYDLGNIHSVKLKDEELLFESWPLYIFGHDKMGHPVFYDEVASADASKIYEIFKSAANGDGEQDSMRLVRMFRFKFYAKMTRYKQVLSEQYNTTILQDILVMDLKDFSYLSVAANFNFYVKIVQSVISDEQLMFPETSYRLMLINCPRSFTMFWKVISTVIDPSVKEKVKILGSDFLKEMLKDIDIDQIPPRYGGTSKLKIRLGDVAEQL